MKIKNVLLLFLTPLFLLGLRVEKSMAGCTLLDQSSCFKDLQQSVEDAINGEDLPSPQEIINRTGKQIQEVIERDLNWRRLEEEFMKAEDQLRGAAYKAFLDSCPGGRTGRINVKNMIRGKAYFLVEKIGGNRVDTPYGQMLEQGQEFSTSICNGWIARVKIKSPCGKRVLGSSEARIYKHDRFTAYKNGFQRQNGQALAGAGIFAGFAGSALAMIYGDVDAETLKLLGVREAGIISDCIKSKTGIDHAICAANLYNHITNTLVIKTINSDPCMLAKVKEGQKYIRDSKEGGIIKRREVRNGKVIDVNTEIIKSEKQKARDLARRYNIGFSCETTSCVEKKFQEQRAKERKRKSSEHLDILFEAMEDL